METFVPPYTTERGWQLYTAINISRYLWVAYRHKPLTGEIVMQMGTNPGSTGFQMGDLKIGFQHTFKTTAASNERWVTDVSAGPITTRGPVYILSRIGIRLTGPGIDAPEEEIVQSYERTRLYIQANAPANATCAVTVYGHIQFGFDPGQTPYAEIITAFPTVFSVSQPRIQTLAAGQASDPRLNELKPGKPVLRKVSLEEARHAGDAGFEGGSDAPPPKRRPGRK